MLVLNKGPVEVIPVPLSPGVVWRIRPATEFQVDIAAAEATRILMGVAAVGDAVEEAAILLGEEFRAADFRDEKWLKAASERIALIELSAVCTESWQGFLWKNEDGSTIEVTDPDRSYIAVALRDPSIAARIKQALYVGVHEVIAEKKGSAALPNGGAAEGGQSVPVASPPGT